MANISIYIHPETLMLDPLVLWRNFLLPSLLWHFLAREENNLDTKLEDKIIVHVPSAFEDKNRKIFAIFLLKFHCISTSIGCFLSTPILKSMLQL